MGLNKRKMLVKTFAVLALVAVASSTPFVHGTNGDVLSESAVVEADYMIPAHEETESELVAKFAPDMLIQENTFKTYPKELAEEMMLADAAPAKKAPAKKAPVKKAPVKKAPVKKAPAKAESVAKAIKKAVKKVVMKAKKAPAKKAPKKAPKKTGCVCPPSKKALKKKKAAQKQKKAFKKKEAMPVKQRDEVFKKLTSDDKDGKKEKNTPQLSKKAPAKKDAKKKPPAKKDAKKKAPTKKAPAKKVVAKKAPAKKKTADDYADELYVLLQTESQFEFDWGDLKIPKVEPKPAEPVVKVLEGKLVKGIKGFCQVKTVLHAAKKLACQRALEWCNELKSWGLHGMAETECAKMVALHKE